MDKKKLKLSISGNTKKTISNIEQAKSNPKNSFIINLLSFLITLFPFYIHYIDS